MKKGNSLRFQKVNNILIYVELEQWKITHWPNVLLKKVMEQKLKSNVITYKKHPCPLFFNFSKGKSRWHQHL